MAARVGQIADGTSKTVLAGEKAMEPRFYETCGESTDTNPSKGNPGDNSSMYQGYDVDSTRSGPPDQDHNDFPGHEDRFGSAHPGAAHIAFCDGSVQAIDYDIESGVWGEYASRDDSQP
jgi:prepilin-type processing-associated H-X9-DG protein